MTKSFNQYLTERHDGDGDCMTAAVDLMMRFNSAFFGKPIKSTSGKPVLVHALVYGQGSVAGLRFPHAWVEDGDMVIDQSNGNDIRIDKRVYYAIGKIKPNEKGAYNTYTYIEMTRKLRSTGHYGPWDLDEKLEEAKDITIQIHELGKGIAGTYNFEIAEQKVHESTLLSRHNGHPLNIMIEKVWCATFCQGLFSYFKK